MKMTVFTLIVIFTSFVCRADNPIIQTCFTADPAPLVYDSTVYVYVGHDSANAPNDTYLMRAWKCYSSKDMVNWTDHGVVLPTSDINWSGGDADAAEVVYRNGKFYYYISTQGPGGISVGVAVADSPLGPFTDIGQPLIRGDQMTGCNATHSWRGLDPTVLIDDDGQAYLYTGNNVLYWVKLNADMISWSGTVSCLPQTDPAFAPDYEEAPWIYKRDGLYYMVFASEFPECVRYCTSSSPTGSWTYGGLIMDKQPNGVSNTIHPGVCHFKGNSYLFYHNAGLPNGGSYRRSVCVEQFEYNEDGTIPKIPETKEGVVTGVGNLNPYDTVQAETICWSSGVSTEPCSEGGLNIYKISNQDYIKVEGVNFKDGAESFEARVASGGSGGNIELRLDNQNGELVGTCAVESTGGEQKWETASIDVSGASGVHDLFLKFTGGNGDLFNFNWWRFTPIPTKTRNKNRSGLDNRMKAPSVAITVRTLRLDFHGPVPHGSLTIKLFDLSGKLVTTLFSENKKNSLELPFGATTRRTGTYLMRILSGTSTITEMIVIVLK